jgi:nitric oxide synthase-interacting protein
MKDFDACSLCLGTAVDPLICPKGHLFCKGCIYESLLAQKQHIKKQDRLYEEQQKEKQTEAKSGEEEKKIRDIEQFDRIESSILPQRASGSSPAPPLGYVAAPAANKPGSHIFLVDKQIVQRHAQTTSKLSKDDIELRKKILPCYWIPNLTPEAHEKKIEKPDPHTMCPPGPHTLRLKQLTAVNFKAFDEKEQAAGKGKGPNRFACSACRRTLTKTTKMSCLKRCGHVMCNTCVQQFAQRDGQCVDCGKEVRKADIIDLQVGGGFAATGAHVAEAMLSHSFQCS